MVWFFKKRNVSEEDLKLLKDIESGIGTGNLLFYEASVELRLKTGILKLDKEILKEALSLYRLAIRDCKSTIKKADKEKLINNLKRAADLAQELDKLLNFEEKYHNSKNLYLLLEKLQKNKKEPIPEIKEVVEFNEKDFYFIPKEYIQKDTTQNYRNFLKEAGYGDLDSCKGILIEKEI